VYLLIKAILFLEKQLDGTNSFAETPKRHCYSTVFGVKLNCLYVSQKVHLLINIAELLLVDGKAIRIHNYLT